MSKKMCKIVNQKLQKEDPDKYRKLIRNATHYCKACGLVCNKKECLCKPEPLQEE